MKTDVEKSTISPLFSKHVRPSTQGEARASCENTIIPLFSKHVRPSTQGEARASCENDRVYYNNYINIYLSWCALMCVWRCRGHGLYQRPQSFCLANVLNAGMGSRQACCIRRTSCTVHDIMHHSPHVILNEACRTAGACSSSFQLRHASTTLYINGPKCKN